MPYKIEKCKECGCGTYKVITTTTGKVHAKHTTLKKAQAQVRLLEGLEKQAKPKIVEAPTKRMLKDKPCGMQCSHQPLTY
jgi:hypothetical protein